MKMKTIDHIALSVEDPESAANWYISNFNGELLYCDDTWSFVQFENIKMAFVKKGTHPAHFAFKVDRFDEVLQERSLGKYLRANKISRKNLTLI